MINVTGKIKTKLVEIKCLFCNKIEITHIKSIVNPYCPECLIENPWMNIKCIPGCAVYEEAYIP